MNLIQQCSFVNAAGGLTSSSVKLGGNEVKDEAGLDKAKKHNYVN